MFYLGGKGCDRWATHTIIVREMIESLILHSCAHIITLNLPQSPYTRPPIVHMEPIGAEVWSRCGEYHPNYCIYSLISFISHLKQSFRIYTYNEETNGLNCLSSKHRVTAYALPWSLLTWIPGALPCDRGNGDPPCPWIGPFGPAVSAVHDLTARAAPWLSHLNSGSAVCDVTALQASD